MAGWCKPMGGLVALATIVVGLPAVASPAAVPPVPLLGQTTPTSALPERKTITLIVEGEPQPATFLLYQNPAYPLITYYPDSMDVEEFCDDDGCAIAFTNRSVGTATVFLFPAEVTTAAGMEPYITQVVSENDWQVNGNYDEGEFLAYPWLRRIWVFQSEDWSVMGTAYFGEASGRGFGVLSVFPPDAGDGYAPRVGAMLDETQILPRLEE